MTTDLGATREIEGNTVKIRKSHPVPEKPEIGKVPIIDYRFGGNKKDKGKGKEGMMERERKG